MGTAGNWFIKRLLGRLGRELVTESAEASQEDAFLQHTVHTPPYMYNLWKRSWRKPQIKEKVCAMKKSL